MSARERARKRQIYEIPKGEGEAEAFFGAVGLPKHQRDRQKRREWLESNRNRALEEEFWQAFRVALPHLPPLNRRSQLDHQLSEAMDKGLLGHSEISSLEDNPREVKTRLPKAIALMEECLEELVALGFWKRSPNAPKLSE